MELALVKLEGGVVTKGCLLTKQDWRGHKVAEVVRATLLAILHEIIKHRGGGGRGS